jgi:predicted DNA-binding transcriptional regulator YafY
MVLERDDEVTAHVLIEGHHAAREARRPGAEVIEWRDGAVVLAVRVINRDAFRTWVLGLGAAAEVLAPAELRDEMASWLREVAR